MLIELIKKFTNSTEKFIQLDFSRKESGQILLQIFKMKTVQVWSDDIQFKSNTGYVLLLHFHNSKTNNENNYENFKNSRYFDDSKKIKEIPREEYFLHIEELISIQEFNDYLLNLLDTIYGANFDRKAEIKIF